MESTPENLARESVSGAESERLRQLVANPSPAAAEELRRELREKPEEAHLHAALGMVLEGLGDLEGALDALDQAHYLRPQSAFILYNYGLALERAGRPREARRRYEAALRLNPEHARVRERLSALAADPPTPAPPAPKQAPVEAEEVASEEGEPSAPEEPAAAEPHPPVVPAVELASAVPEPAPEALLADSGLYPPYESRPPVSPDWEPETLPGFLSLGQSVLMLWFQQPLLWLAVPALPAAALALLVPKGPGWIGPLLWLASLAVAGGPLLGSMCQQVLHGQPFPDGGRKPGEWLRAIAMVAPPVFLSVAPFCVLLALQVPWEGWLVTSAMLVMTLPFQALLAPALVRALVQRAPLGRALALAFRNAGSRLWLHLALMLMFSLALGLLLAFMGIVARDSTRGLGHAVIRALEVGAVSLVGSFWGALMSLCGLDALAAESLASTEAEEGANG